MSHSFLFSAAQIRDDPNSIQNALEKGTDVNIEEGFDRDTPLIVASFNGHEQNVQVLLKNGADIEKRNVHGATALYVAAMGGFSSIVKLLLYSGANPNTTINMGHSAVSIAAENGRFDALRLLVDRGGTIESTAEHGWAPLHQAAKNGHTQIVEFFIEKGANVNPVVKKFGATPLDLAKEYGHHDVVAILEENSGREGTGSTPRSKLEEMTTNGVYCESCKTRYSLSEVLEPYLSVSGYCGFQCPKCCINVLYNPESDSSLGSNESMIRKRWWQFWRRWEN